MHTAPKVDERFSIGFIPVLKTSQADGKRRLHGVASSTVRDRHGDVMSRTALEDMLEQSNGGLTIFLNHSYNVPEDVAGTVEKASLKRVTDDIHDLSFDIVINERNSRAVEAWEAMHEQGTKLGLSIGAMIPDGGAKVDRKTGAYTIDHVELVETSIVGVPANPRSWVEYAAKALRKQESALQPLPLRTGGWVGDTTGTISTTDFKFSIGDPPNPDSDDGESDGDETNVEPPPIHPTPESEYEPPAEPVTTDDMNDPAVNEDGSDQAEAARTEKRIDQTPKQDPVDPPEQDDRDEVKDHEVEPPPIEPVPDSPAPEEPVTTDDLLKLADAASGKATVTVETPYANVTVDTGNRGKDTAAGSSTTSQEAPESAPENEESASAPEYPWMGIPGNPPVQQAIESIATRELDQSALLFTQLSSELSRVTKELFDERNLRLTAERERDEASRDLTKVLRETDEMLKKLASTPVGKRTTYHEAVGRYEAIKTYYGEEFTDHLARSME